MYLPLSKFESIDRVYTDALHYGVNTHQPKAQASRPVAYSDTPGDRSVNRHSMYRLKFREWEIHI